MWFNETIELGSASESVSNGESLKTITWATVYADKQGVRSKEFYEGQSIGLKPETMFVVRTQEYTGQDQVRYNSQVYQVIRTYAKGDFTELVVSKFVG